MICEETAIEEIVSVRNEAEQQLEGERRVDIIFMNVPARKAFLEHRGYAVPDKIDDCEGDGLLLTFALAVAYMTTMLKYITFRGTGRSRNDVFIESFKKLVPRALAHIIKEIWCDISGQASHELVLHIGNSAEHVDDPYGNNSRDWTLVKRNIDDNYLYILAKSKYFREKVCSWYVEIKDAHIGRYDSTSKELRMIDESMVLEKQEDIDVHQVVAT